MLSSLNVDTWYSLCSYTYAHRVGCKHARVSFAPPLPLLCRGYAARKYARALRHGHLLR